MADAAPTPYTEEQNALCLEAELAVFQALVNMFGKRWASDPAPASVEDAEVKRLRIAFAVPIGQGAANSVVAFFNETAPMDGTKDGLMRHVHAAFAQAVAVTTMRGRPMGSYWIHVRDHAPTKGKPPSIRSDADTIWPDRVRAAITEDGTLCIDFGGNDGEIIDSFALPHEQAMGLVSEAWAMLTKWRADHGEKGNG